MPKLPRLSGYEVIKILSDFGFKKKRQKGSHVILIKTTKEGKVGCAVPLHDELEIGTLLGILRQAKIDKKDFLKFFNK